jgi:hypothetical protein
MEKGTAVVHDRRYYFANTLAAAFEVLMAIPGRKPEPWENSGWVGTNHILWMAVRAAKLNVRDFNDARDAAAWIRRIMQAMERNGLWSREEAQALHNLDKEQHFHLPLAA